MALYEAGDYAAAQAIFEALGGYEQAAFYARRCEWWLRTPGDHRGQCCRVLPDGRFCPRTRANKADVCVRPALWLAL